MNIAMEATEASSEDFSFIEYPQHIKPGPLSAILHLSSTRLYAGAWLTSQVCAGVCQRAVEKQVWGCIHPRKQR